MANDPPIEKTFKGHTGHAEPKIGIEEFLSIAQRFGFDADTMAKLRELLSVEQLPEGGPNLARYMSAHPAPPFGEAFDELAKGTFDVRFARGVSSGTGALHAALIGIGARPGREIICPAIGFLATSAAVALTGATPVFCDIDESLQMDPSAIEPLINERTLALVPTHHWGGVVDMDGVMDVARRHGLKVVEDCAQSPGASFHGRPVGSIGDAGCFSIACYKIIGGGEGGLLTTNDEAIFSRAMQLAECGGFWRPDRFAPQRYEGELFVGTNYRMSELEAAVDIVQLRKLPGIVSRYRSVFRRVTERLQRRRGIVPQKLNDPEGTIGYMLRFFPETHELAAKIAAELNAAGITAEHRGRDAHPDWHLYRDMFPVASCDGSPTTPGRCPVAEDLFDRGIIVHLDQWWSPEDANAAGDVIDHVLGRHCDASADAPAWM